MLPIRDVIPSRTTPWMTITLAGVTALAALWWHFLPSDTRVALLFRVGLIPAHASWLAVPTSILFHDNLLDAGCNLLVLWIFGENVEDQLGHVRMLLLYVLAGAAGAYAHTLLMPASAMPIIGAGSAVAGLMAAYFLMFPRSRVLVLVPLVLSFDLVEIPAAVIPVVWLLIQLLGEAGRSGLLSGGMVWTAEMAGGVAGLLLVPLLRRAERRRVEWWGQ